MSEAQPTAINTDRKPAVRRRVRRAIAASLLFVAVAIVGLAQVVYADMPSPRFEAMQPVANIGTLSANQCGACHKTIYDEWQQSGHARAFTDPLYQAELAHQPAPFGCHRCHSPLQEQREELVHGLLVALPGFFIEFDSDNARFDASLRDEGVTCVTCHQVDNSIAGPFGDTQATHPTFKTDLRAVENCQRCHEQHLDILGRKLQRPIMDTVVEWEAYRAKGGDQRCADCHLPRLDTPRPLTATGPARAATSHSLRGPWEDAFVDTALVVHDLSFTPTPGAATISLVLENGSGHRVPTAEPARRVLVTLELVDAAGKVLASDEHRIERPVDVLRLREKPGLETSLLPRERRPIQLTVPRAENAVAAEFRVSFWRWDPHDASAIAAGLGPAQLEHRVVERRFDL